jgi:hypothetical protein
VSEDLYGRAPTTPGFATLVASGVVLPAVPGRKIRVYALLVNPLAATQVTLLSNATPISGIFSLAATGGFVLPYCTKPWMVTGVGESLSLTMSIATTVGVQFLYDLSI